MLKIVLPLMHSLPILSTLSRENFVVLYNKNIFNQDSNFGDLPKMKVQSSVTVNYNCEMVAQKAGFVLCAGLVSYMNYNLYQLALDKPQNKSYTILMVLAIIISEEILSIF